MAEQTLTNEFPTAEDTTVTTISIYRRCVGVTAIGQEFEYCAAGKSAVQARHVYDAARAFIELGLSGPFQVVADGKVVWMDSFERAARLTAEEDPDLRVRKWRPKSRVRMAARGWPQGAGSKTKGEGHSSSPKKKRASKGACPPQVGDWIYQTQHGATVTHDGQQWIVEYKDHRHYCRSKVGLRRWLGGDPILETLPEHFHEWHQPCPKGTP